ncbi:hypothetical protein BJV77DRAFT_968328 [Russula vinacea]|nr:hypothetical protein BJV77DRAFT_968328 [Russula vinacea]
MRSVQSLEPLRRQPERAMAKLADWCYSCMDGGDLIHVTCARGYMHDACLELPISFTDLEKSAYRFVCPTCHNNFYHANKPLPPYFGCTKVASLRLEHKYQSIPKAASQDSWPIFLTYGAKQGSLLFQEVKFNIYNEDDAGIHADRMEDLARIISKKHDGTPVWLFITTMGTRNVATYSTTQRLPIMWTHSLTWC